jgi:long-chain acyl-CoA synthetase
MLVEHLLNHGQKQPAELAVIDDRGQLTYGQLAAMAGASAAMVAKATDRPHVGLMLPSSAAFVANFYGILLAGKAVVPINFLLSEREVAHVLADSGIDTVITAGPLAARLANTGLRVIDLAAPSAIPAPPSAPPTSAAVPPPPSKSASDLAVLMYTSGTSGLPKGVRLTYGNLQSDVDASIEIAALQKRHRFLGIIPLFHAFGMTAMMLAPIQLGASVIYMARFSAPAALAAIRDQGASIFFGVPSMFAAIAHLKSATAADFANTYALITGAEPQPAMLRQAFAQRFNIPLLEGYGLTETSPVIALNTPQVRRAGSAGKPLPNAKVRITDDSGNALPPTETGEILLAGPMVFQGYHNLPDLTEAAFTPDGFFKTGDLGHLDPDGFLFITGRKKDLIIVAGEKAAPREIEEMLMRHPAVAEAAVLGKKDPSRGEVVVAFITARPGQSAKPDELRDFCRGQGLAQWKIPREITLLDEMPRSPTGKILKRQLAETLART